MTKTRSSEMKIEREKGYVWFLVGMSMRSAIWNRILDRIFVQFLQKFDLKCFQNGTKWDPDGLWHPVWARERSQAASGQFDAAILGPKIGPESDPEAFKNRFGKRLRNKLVFESDLGPILDRFSSRSKQIFDPNWKPLLAKWTWNETKTNSLNTM